jgi:hypothetical protein
VKPFSLAIVATPATLISVSFRLVPGVGQD